MWIAAAAVLVPIVASEVVLRGRKLQTALAAVFAVWALSFVAAAGAAVGAGNAGTLAIALFWSGVFLVWFGVRSHIESSIFLRLLFLLRRQPLTDEQWIGEYAAFYGEPQRTHELRRGGFLAGHGGDLSVTSKGKALLAVTSFLRGPGPRVVLVLALAAATGVALALQRLTDTPSGLKGIDSLKRCQPEVSPNPLNAKWRGFIAVPRGGPYVFRVVSRGTALVYVEGAEVVRHLGRDDLTEATGSIALHAGVHPLLIRYAHRPGECTFGLSWSRDGAAFEDLPAWAVLPEGDSYARLFAHETAALVLRLLALVWYGFGAVLAVRLLMRGGRRLLASPGERFDPALVAVVGVSAALNLWGITWGMPNTRGWGPDEVVPADVLAALQQAFSNGWHQKYPPFHYMLLAIAYSPTLLASRLGLIDINAVTPYYVLALTGRLLSLFLAAATIVVIYRCGRQLYGRQGAAFAALIVALTIPFAYYAKLANLDVPYLFWFAVSLLAYIRILQRHHTSDYVLFAVSAALAGCTKDQVWGAYVFTAAAILVARWGRVRQTGGSYLRVVFDRTTLLAAAAGVAAFLVADNVVLNASGFAAHVRLLIGTPAEFQQVPRSAAGELQMAWRSIREMGYMFGWPLSVIVALAFVRGVTTRTTVPSLRWLLVPAISYYLLFVGVILFYFDRYLFPVTLVLALFAGYGLDRFLAPGVRARRLRAALVAAAFAYSIVYVAAIDYAMTRDSRYAVTGWLASHAQPDDTIGAFGPLEYFAIAGGFRSISVESMNHVAAVRPAFIVLEPDQLPSWPDRTRAMREALLGGGAGYRLALRVRSRPLPLPGGHPDLGAAPRHGPEVTDLSLINPTMEIFERTADTPQHAMASR